MSDDPNTLTLEEAKALLPDKEYIHTLRDLPIEDGLVLMGFDFPKEELIKLLGQGGRIALSGKSAKSMGHGMAYWDKYYWLFIETKPE
jgi:hypothetical protein